ncbi:hypothetical protein CNMCM8927_004111 [Aspergillus lentulus]|uniref:F-box domain-containing protein n=1 Tax=Aspergillus lentulus TaxID=293939 RepID=A0AAN5YSH4_ASPLE|nr:hypothetical protein CNMCM6069_001610 [Aspergillus lentulus]KAF4207016.1 hypothetical protein CNMCM8927_004111 [Aspergillus lentulus]GFF77017.1 hypothetical protein IFM60648_04850 [Aspergillus lentulus]
MGIDNPISFLDLPPELRIQVYKYLIRSYPDKAIYIELQNSDKYSSKDKQNTTETKSHHAGLAYKYPIMQLSLTNKQVHLEATQVFYTDSLFEVFIELGEKDWQTLYKWLVMIGPHNRRNLRKLLIYYDCLEWAPILEDGRAGERWLTGLSGVDRYHPDDWCKPVGVELSPTREWVELISPTVEKIFKLLAECRNVIVTFLLHIGRLIGRVLYPRLYEAEKGKEYPNSEWFDMSYESHWDFRDPYKMEDVLYDNDLYGEYNFYGPPTRSLLPDLMELYRTRYGRNSISLQWSVILFWKKAETSWRRSLIERSGWDILQWECFPVTNNLKEVVTMDLQKRSQNLQELAAQSSGDLLADMNLCMRCSYDTDEGIVCI